MTEESCWRTVWPQPLGLPPTEQELLVRRSWTRAWPPHWAGLPPLLISPGRAGDVGHRDPHPCMGGVGPAKARRACPQKHHWGPSGRGLKVKAGKSPWIYACPFNDPEPRNSSFFLSLPPVPASAWNPGPTGIAVSPQPSTLALKAAASMSPD